MLIFIEKYENLVSWIKSGNYVSNYESDSLLELRSSDKSLFRVAVIHGVTHPNTVTGYGFETAGGYSAMYPMNYKKYWLNVINPLKDTNKAYYDYVKDWGSRFYLYTGSLPSGARYKTLEPRYFFNLNLLSLINVKYLISHQPLNDNRLVQVDAGINAMDWIIINKVYSD